MKFTVEQYKEALEKAREKTCLYDEIEEAIKGAKEKLYQGLEVGDGVTINLWSDSHAGTIIRRTKCKLIIQRDRAVRTDSNGMSEDQHYTYYPDPMGMIYEAHWSDKRKSFVWSGNSISIGRHEYYDYSF